MTRNQLSPNFVKNWSSSAMFSVDCDGNITPTAQQTVSSGGTIVTQAVTTGNKTFTGHACARQNDVCQCSALVENVSSGYHMTLGTGYRVKTSVTVGSTFEIYAVTASGGTVLNASNGDVVIGST